jgi:DNA/RNA-binding protein KIN17
MLRNFLNVFSRGRKRVSAHSIYQEYIKDRHHVHMKATHWTSLAGFVRYLGKTGRAIIEETDRGWFLTYLGKDPEGDAKKVSEERCLLGLSLE